MAIVPKIKICGLTRMEDIVMCNELGVDYIGFVFATSKRQISKEKCTELRKYVSKKIKVVGVFVNEDIKTVNRISQLCNLDIVQLHGDEDELYYSMVNKPVWKSISVKDGEKIDSNYQKMVSAILLDTFSKDLQGGTGKSFNWEQAKGLSKTMKIVLAGGLTSDNVKKAIQLVKPQIVDVSSGVELDGKKDYNKIKQFIRSVR